MPGCNHNHAAAPHGHQSEAYRKVLWGALLINASMFAIEVGSGLHSNSMSLLADSLDFLGDSANYALSLFVLGMAMGTRAKASLIKGLSLGLFGCGVLVMSLLHLLNGQTPEASTMSAVGTLALVANVAVALMLYKWREGDSNMRSVWLCSRNDAIGNIAVVVAGFLVAWTGSALPDLTVALLMALLGLQSAYVVIQQARVELLTEPQAAQEDGHANHPHPNQKG